MEFVLPLRAASLPVGQLPLRASSLALAPPHPKKGRPMTDFDRTRALQRDLDRLLAQVQWEILPAPGADHPAGEPYFTHQGFMRMFGEMIPCYKVNTGDIAFDPGAVERAFAKARQR